MIKTENLQKIFRTEEVETLALNGVSLEINDGEFVAVMGPSGCGKTTLLNILGLLDNPTGGAYYLNGIEVGKYTEKQQIQEAMDRMEISHRSKHFPQQLSGGQQQRVAIARAVVANPKLILADEPTGNLDSKNGKEVMNLLSELNADGTTIVMVTHSQHDAGYAGRIINLFDGQVVTEAIL